MQVERCEPRAPEPALDEGGPGERERSEPPLP